MKASLSLSLSLSLSFSLPPIFSGAVARRPETKSFMSGNWGNNSQSAIYEQKGAREGKLTSAQRTG